MTGATFSWGVAGAPLERMFMPGPLVEGHAEAESDCRNCHSMFEKGTQNDLCLECHEEVKADIDTTRGFHGLARSVSGEKCSHCHEEHHGRDADIVKLDLDTFDHGETDFSLEGAHQKLDCGLCHEAGKKYREAPSACIACHKEDDAHKGRLGEKCGQCHAETSWQEGKFDHGKTDFPLEGVHKEVACNLCHVNERYEDTPSACFSCHSLNDVHQGRYGQECDRCHAPMGWKEIAFDHDRDTDFPLVGTHRKVTCDACHSGDFKDDTRGRDCFDCHREDDQHRGRHGKECENCHSPQAWLRVKFDHDLDTDFPLRGKHRSVSCEICHKGFVFEEELSSDCYSCHKLDDRHDGALGEDCAECHREDGWKQNQFDHDKDTNFPLRGSHEKLDCQNCHTARGKRDKLKTGCYDCHQEDDVHQGQEGEACDRCHNEQGWRSEVFFDHDLTRFPLIGLHAVTTCEECHLTSEYKEAPLECNECHESDDVHKGRLGPECGLCHNPNGWSLWQFDHNAQTDFVLDGAHEGLHCHACHDRPVAARIELSMGCYGCHRNDDRHEGAFGRNCERCHDTNSFEGARVR